MTKKVTQNVTNSNSEDLTEQWKKGELPSGWYWVKGVRAEGIYAFTSEYLNNIDRPADGEKIVGKVPSYEQWKMVYKTEFELLEQVVKLKELLKEVQSKIRYSSPRGIETFADLDDTLLGKINQVLGEE